MLVCVCAVEVAVVFGFNLPVSDIYMRNIFNRPRSFWANTIFPYRNFHWRATIITTTKKWSIEISCACLSACHVHIDAHANSVQHHTSTIFFYCLNKKTESHQTIRTRTRARSHLQPLIDRTRLILHFSNDAFVLDTNINRWVIALLQFFLYNFRFSFSSFVVTFGLSLSLRKLIVSDPSKLCA